jgi:phenylalanyl-tRNA synthetase beta subunit
VKKKLKITQNKIRKAALKWITPMGLGWWRIHLTYYDDPQEIARDFERDGAITLAIAYADWRYMEATIKFNLLELANYNKSRIEDVVVHELCHILVSEMHQDDPERKEHEERVVTTLQRAVFWLHSFGKECGKH